MNIAIVVIALPANNQSPLFDAYRLSNKQQTDVCCLFVYLSLESMSEAVYCVNFLS